MATIITRAGKGSALTWTEADDNFTNLNTDKVEAADVTSAIAAAVGVSVQAYDATLTAFAGGLTAAGKIPYATALNTLGELDFKDEDDMVSDSATAVPSQQSVKAYVTSSVGTQTSKIQSVDYALAANALTLKLNPTSLDFRSATLTTGAPTTVTNAAQINTTISSGSTGGTVSAVQSDIYILAINNAGTMELAWCNAAGGINLDETTLISTTAEGGAGAADSATVIYSTTARSNVAFRVVGLFRSTQTTAGTWAQTPSLVQGYGGQALAAMSSLGYGQTWQVVTGSRSSGVTYYNTTGKPIFVQAALNALGNITPTVGGVSLGGQYVNCHFIVPSGTSYSITAASLAFWNELR